MPLQRYAIDVQPASRNPATNAAWSRRALGPRPQDFAYTRFLTRGEDTETSYRPPAQRYLERQDVAAAPQNPVKQRARRIESFGFHMTVRVRRGADNIGGEAAACDEGEHHQEGRPRNAQAQSHRRGNRRCEYQQFHV